MQSDTRTDNIDVKYVANLARMNLNDAEKSLFQSQINGIIGYCSKIKELNLDGIEPTSHAVPVYNVFRDDEPHESINRELILKNAPVASDDQVLVPVIIE